MQAARIFVLIAGDALPADLDVDFAFSIGVLHHIPDPDAVVRAAFAALRPGGKMGIWLYGREGNGLYLAVLTPLRAVTKRLPHAALAALVRLVDLPLVAYVALCRVLPLPLGGYMREVVMPGMARLLHRPAYDFTRPYEYNRSRRALGCYHCHQVSLE